MNNMFVSNAASSALGAKRVAKPATPAAEVPSKPVFDIPPLPEVAQPRSACKFEKIEKMVTHLQEDVRELQDIVKYFAEILTQFGDKLPDNGGRTISDEIHAFDDVENASDEDESDHNISDDVSDDNDDNDDNDENNDNEDNDDPEGSQFDGYFDEGNAHRNDEEGSTDIDVEND